MLKLMLDCINRPEKSGMKPINRPTILLIDLASYPSTFDSVLPSTD
ncbi:hypothetical protein ACIQW7_09940 [Peribacillus simplex]